MAIIAAALLSAGPARAVDAPGIRWPEPGGGLTIARPFARSEIAVHLSGRVAGAIDSLTWDGIAFIDAGAKGRALQSAAAFGGGGACHRVTEAGGEADDAADRPSSRLLSLRHGRAWAETETRLARSSPATGERCPRGSGPSANPGSDITLRKRVAIGLPGVPNAIEVQASFDLPGPEAGAMIFEALTATLRPEFSKAWSFDPASGAIGPLPAGPGEQGRPVILSTPEGSHALGVWSPALPQADRPESGYGRSISGGMADADAAVTLTCTFRARNPSAGPNDFTCYALVGSLADVRAGLAALSAPR